METEEEIEEEIELELDSELIINEVPVQNVSNYNETTITEAKTVNIVNAVTVNSESV